MADNTLSPDEQKFFETGGEMQPGIQGTPPADTPDPLALAGLGNVEAQPALKPAEQQPALKPADEQQAPPTNADIAEVLRRSLAEAQQRAADLAAQLEAAKRPIEHPKPAPDPTTDPLGSMLHQLDTVNKSVAELQAQLTAQQTQQQQVSQFQQFQAHVQALRTEFMKTSPDFPDAYTHLRTARVTDLRSVGVPEANIQTQIFQEEVAVAENAIRNGKNPAEVIYEMSKRHGYTPKAPAVPNAAEAKLDAIKRGSVANLNLPKSIVPEDFTMESLKDASDADLNKLVVDPKSWAKIVGKDSYPL